MSFEAFIEDRLREVLNNNTRTQPLLRQFTVEGLSYLESQATDLLDDEITFTTVANQQVYGNSTEALIPASIDHVYSAQTTLSSSFGYTPLEYVPLEVINELGTTPGRPSRYTLWEQEIYLAPIPSSAWDIKLQFRRSSMRDESTGALITVDSTTATNEWLTPPGSLALAAYVRGAYALVMADVEAYGAHQRDLGIKLNVLRRSTAKRRPRNYQAKPYRRRRTRDDIFFGIHPDLLA